MTDFKDERSEPQSGWDARSKRSSPDVQVIVLSLLTTTFFLQKYPRQISLQNTLNFQLLPTLTN